MNILKQVCTKDQGKWLLELGVKNESLFCYTGEWHVSEDPQSVDLTSTVYSEFAGWAYNSRIPAFTVSELGVMLSSESGKYVVQTAYNDHFGEWNCEYFVMKETDEEIEWQLEHSEEWESEAVARAHMLIHLLEKKKLTVEEVNQRLIKS